MNKILIALVLAVVMSGNVYANFITDFFKDDVKEITCLEVVEKGTLIIHEKNERQPQNSNKKYVYKGKEVTYYYNDRECLMKRN